MKNKMITPMNRRLSGQLLIACLLASCSTGSITAPVTAPTKQMTSTQAASLPKITSRQAMIPFRFAMPKPSRGLKTKALDQDQVMGADLINLEIVGLAEPFSAMITLRALGGNDGRTPNLLDSPTIDDPSGFYDVVNTNDAMIFTHLSADDSTVEGALVINLPAETDEFPNLVFKASAYEAGDPNVMIPGAMVKGYFSAVAGELSNVVQCNWGRGPVADILERLWESEDEDGPTLAAAIDADALQTRVNEIIGTTWRDNLQTFTALSHPSFINTDAIVTDLLAGYTPEGDLAALTAGLVMTGRLTPGTISANTVRVLDEATNNPIVGLPVTWGLNDPYSSSLNSTSGTGGGLPDAMTMTLDNAFLIDGLSQNYHVWLTYNDGDEDNTLTENLPLDGGDASMPNRGTATITSTTPIDFLIPSTFMPDITSIVGPITTDFDGNPLTDGAARLGNTITINGTRFVSPTVTIGGVQATVTSATFTRILAVIPAGSPAGDNTVVVYNSNDTDLSDSANASVGPSITNVSPGQLTVDHDGDYVINITGSAFSTGTKPSVRLVPQNGDDTQTYVEATGAQVTVNSSTSITVTFTLTTVNNTVPLRALVINPVLGSTPRLANLATASSHVQLKKN